MKSVPNYKCEKERTEKIQMKEIQKGFIRMVRSSLSVG